MRVALFLTLLAGSTISAEEWPRFRGPNGSGLSNSRGIPVQWTADDVHWKMTLTGRGHSSPVAWGERVFVTSADDKSGTRYVACLDGGSGRKLWQREFTGSKQRHHEDNSAASATPAVDADRLYVSFGNAQEFLIIALSHDGTEVWRTDLGPYQAGHGFGASLIVHENVVVVANEQNGPSSLIGLESSTGKISWKTARKSKTHYATPCIFQTSGRPAELIFASYEHGVSSVNPKTGDINWELDIFYKEHVESSIASPIVAGDLIFATCGWLGVHYETVAVRPGANAAKAQIAYRVTKTAPLVPTPLVKDDLLFLLSDRGILTCVNTKDGKEHWRQRVLNDSYSSPICIGNTLYCISRRGEVVAVAASDSFTELGRSDLGEGTHATPAVANGRLYFRTFSQVLCVGEKK